MSTENIIDITELPNNAGVAVTFRTHGHEGSRIYFYSKADGDLIKAGADPAGFSGSTEEPDLIANAIGSAIERFIDIAAAGSL